MGIVYTLALILMVMLNSIELSSQSESWQNDSSSSDVSRSGPSCSFSKKQHPPTTPHFRIRSSSPAEDTLRQRSRSPPDNHVVPSTMTSFSTVLGYGLDELQFLRLIPVKSPHRQFQIRRYTFPANSALAILQKRKVFRPVPTEEQIVLSTSDGDVLAILDSNKFFIGIYTYNPITESKGRAKINMENGTITLMTADEVKETAVGSNRSILRFYHIEHVHDSHGSLLTRGMTPPTRLPSSDRFGYGLDQIEFIRLIPKKNPKRIFELRRYTFPAEKTILFLEKPNHYGRMPLQEQIVVSTSSGDVFALLESIDCLAGIYTYNTRKSGRVRSKINMQSGEITQLTAYEVEEIPVGRLRPILSNFRVHRIHEYTSRVLTK